MGSLACSCEYPNVPIPCGCTIPPVRLSRTSLLICVGSLLTLNPSAHAQQSDGSSPIVVVNGLDSAGVALISPEDPNFDSTAKRLLSPKTATVVLNLKPSVVIVSNRSTRAVVCFALVWKITDKDGRTSTTSVQFKYPDALTGVPETNLDNPRSREGLSLMSGESRIAAPEMEIGPSWDDDFYLNQLREYAESQNRDLSTASRVEIDLDAAIFSDGLLVGPDQTNVDKDFTLYFESKQKLFRQIVSDIDAGRTLDQAFDPIKTLAANRISPRDRAGFYQTLAAQDINRLRRRLGDSAVTETVRRSVRTEPFAVHRE
jgi:hypothetical protein